MNNKYQITVIQVNQPDLNADYKKIVAKLRFKDSYVRKLRTVIESFKYKPLISVIMPVLSPEVRWLEKAIKSVLNQIYPHWELCVCSGGPTSEGIHSMLNEYANKDNRIKVAFLQENGGISNASNVALSMANGEFIALLDHDDELSLDALFEVVKLLQQNPDADIIYSDEDKIDEKGELSDPFFKPDWSPDLFFSMMYIGHLGVCRKKLVEEVGGLRKEFEGAHDYDLVLRLLDKTTKVYHIPKVLYHRRKAAHSTPYSENAKLYAHDAGKRALQDYFVRNEIEADVMDHPRYLLCYRVVYRIKDNPLVSIIILTRNKGYLLKQCVESIFTSSYKNYEIIVINHDSYEKETLDYLNSLSAHPNCRILSYSSVFNFAKMNNFAVEHSNGEYLIFLNNDTKVISPGWIEEMLMHAQRKEIGVVGVKLLYPDNTIQHGGVVMLPGGPAHVFANFFDKDAGYFHFPHVVRNCSAVTAACMMTRRSVFEEVGGFDESFPVNYNDVDFCLKVMKKGYWIVYTPYAVLYHYESATRRAKVFFDEINRLKSKWGEMFERDPFYNVNFDLSVPPYCKLKLG